MGRSVLFLDLYLLHIAQIVTDYGVKHKRIIYWEKNQIALRATGRKRGHVSVFREPDSIWQSDQYLVMPVGKRLGAKEGITQSQRLLLDYIKNFGGEVALRIVAHDVSLFR